MIKKYKLVFCYPSRDKENEGTELLYAPLPIPYLARHTPAYYDISAYDEYVGEDMDPETVEADLVAVSAITPGITRAYEIGDILRARGITCVIGGAHATALPEESLEHFDSVVMGEGEGPWKIFLEDFEKGNIQKTYFGSMNVSLENLGTPRREFIDKNYQYHSVLTSRGCPYSCSFCYLTVFKNRKFRMIPHDTVLEDLETLRKEELVIFTDENFIGYSKVHIEDRKVLLRKMIERKFKFLWGCQTTVALSDEPELMDLMFKAGCRAVFVGFESTNPEDLASIRKKHNVGVDYRAAIEKLHKHKLAVIASCILGMDTHTNEYHKQLIKDIKAIKADFVRVFLMTAWPGTALYKELQEEGRASNDWDRVRKDVPSIKFKHYTHEEIIIARKEVMDSFFRPFNLFRVGLRWVFVDRSLLKLFIRMGIRNKTSEKIRISRAVKFSKKPEIMEQVAK